ncbi:MAG: FAD-binding oxidoreductase [Deltaproteobacteria bacterium]|nr:FAD-binding oxidoreductase [Deltaproteobacteria bacterium]
MDVTRPDILILGAGILGSSAAWQLAERGAGSIGVLDLDLAGTFSSSERNAGGCRATWWHPINAELSWRSLQFYEEIAAEIQFFQRGYLFLYSPRRWAVAREKKAQYDRLGIPVEYLAPDEIRARLPEFENLKGVAGATFSPKDGLLDPHLLKEYYRARAKALEVKFLDGFYFTGAELRGRRVEAVHALRRTSPPSEEVLEEIHTRHEVDRGGPWEREVFRPKAVINCTGAWFPVSSRHLGYASPVQPVRRQISLFESHAEDFSDRGMIVDSSGLYLHAEGAHSGRVLAGYSNRDERPSYSFRYDGEPFFDKKIWLRLYRRGGRRRFEAIRHLRGWAGLYAVSPDKSGILGRAGELENLYELGAATGRGVMQSYMLGKLTAELIATGRFQTFDAAPLSGGRFARGEFLLEALDI